MKFDLNLRGNCKTSSPRSARGADPTEIPHGRGNTPCAPIKRKGFCNCLLRKTFRVLVIDDLVCRGKEGLAPDEIQNAVTNYLFHLARKTASGCWVEVCYVSTPEEGVSRWTQEVFDLTLVDSNFKVKDHKTNEDYWKRSFLDINIEFTGVYLFKFFEEMLKGSEYGDYRKGCKIALWTGLKYEVIAKPRR